MAFEGLTFRKREKIMKYDRNVIFISFQIKMPQKIESERRDCQKLK